MDDNKTFLERNKIEIALVGFLLVFVTVWIINYNDPAKQKRDEEALKRQNWIAESQQREQQHKRDFQALTGKPLKSEESSFIWYLLFGGVASAGVIFVIRRFKSGAPEPVRPSPRMHESEFRAVPKSNSPRKPF